MTTQIHAPQFGLNKTNTPAQKIFSCHSFVDGDLAEGISLIPPQHEGHVPFLQVGTWTVGLDRHEEPQVSLQTARLQHIQPKNPQKRGFYVLTVVPAEEEDPGVVVYVTTGPKDLGELEHPSVRWSGIYPMPADEPFSMITDVRNEGDAKRTAQDALVSLSAGDAVLVATADGSFYQLTAAAGGKLLVREADEELVALVVMRPHLERSYDTLCRAAGNHQQKLIDGICHAAITIAQHHSIWVLGHGCKEQIQDILELAYEHAGRAVQDRLNSMALSPSSRFLPDTKVIDLDSRRSDSSDKNKKQRKAHKRAGSKEEYERRMTANNVRRQG